MQNADLGVALAYKHFQPETALPGACSRSGASPRRPARAVLCAVRLSDNDAALSFAHIQRAGFTHARPLLEHFTLFFNAETNSGMVGTMPANYLNEANGPADSRKLNQSR